jgi:lipopolysaccharide export system permease protein
MSNQNQSKNMSMLQAAVDSMSYRNDSIGRNYYREAVAGAYRPIDLGQDDTLKIAQARMADYNVDSLFDISTLSQKQKVIQQAVSRAESVGSDWNFKSFNVTQTDSSMRRHQVGWHEKITVSLACLIFLFIGAPLGGIIRKGGLGMPVVVSVLFFIVYYVINNTGVKMARDGHWIVWMGMWTSTAVLAPLGAFLTYKSNNDSVVLNADAYVAWLKRVIGIRSVRHLFRKEVIIHDPDYPKLNGQLSDLTDECIAYLQANDLQHAPNYLRLWMSASADHSIEHINIHLEGIVDELSNTRSNHLLAALNTYPIIPERAHLRPFRNRWLNLLCGVVVPVGLFFYFRIWIFRIRLRKDVLTVVQTNKEIQTLII